MPSKKSEGAAIAKRAKIDKAQRNMFIAVCLASIALGVTLTFAIYFIKVIGFNAKVLSEKNEAVDGFKEAQSNLEQLKESVGSLSSNEYLESVARVRDNNKCIGSTDKDTTDEAQGLEAMGIAKVCSSLRVIPDALPASLNGNATLASMNWLLIQAYDGSGVGIESLGAGDVGGFSDSGEETEDGSTTQTIHTIGVSLSLTDNSSRVKSALDTIEKSIRNFDIDSATIAWNEEGGDQIEFTGTYRTYYSDKVRLDFKEKQVCADETSEKCTSGGSSIDDEGSE